MAFFRPIRNETLCNERVHNERIKFDGHLTIVKWYTVRQFSMLSDIPASTVYYKIRKGYLPAKKIDGKLRIPSWIIV